MGGEAQTVQIMLKQQDKITARPGSMCYMSGALQMESVYAPEIEGGLWQWLFGRNMTSIVIFNPVSDDGFVGIAAPSLARIIPACFLTSLPDKFIVNKIDMTNFGGELLCQPDAFLCSMGDVAVTNTVDQRGGRNAVITAEGILKQKLSGQGLAFVLAGGSVAQKILVAGEVLVVDTSCIVAMTNTVGFQIKYTGPIRRVVLGGENQVTAVLTGPGIIFIQSLPFYRLSQRAARAVTSPGMKDNPKIFIQTLMFFILAYVMIVSSLILTDG